MFFKVGQDQQVSSLSTTVTMDSDKAVVANFVKKKYALTD